MKLIKNHFFKLLQNKLISGSLVLFVGTTAVNLSNYLYHLFMGRMLGPADYGVLVSLMSLAYFSMVISLSLNTVVVRFTSIFKAKKDYPRIYSLFRGFSRYSLLLGASIFLLFILGHRSVAEFLNISNYQAIVLVASTFLIRFLVPINNGLIQGFLNFKFLSANNMLAAVSKLIIALFLVKAGFSVLGAVLAFVIADYLTYLVSFLPLRFLFQHRAKTLNVNWRETINYAGPAFIVVLSLTSLYTSDIILIKHFLEPYQAGLYSALGVLGKIIFFASGAITMAMFPLVAERHENGRKYKNIFFQAFFLVGMISAGITLLYFLAPKIMILLLYGSSYLEIAPLLGFFGIFISFHTLSYVLTNFFLSIHKTDVAVFPVMAACTQIGLIWFFHTSLLQVIQISILVTALLLTSLLLYFVYSYRKA